MSLEIFGKGSEDKIISFKLRVVMMWVLKGGFIMVLEASRLLLMLVVVSVYGDRAVIITREELRLLDLLLDWSLLDLGLGLGLVENVLLGLLEAKFLLEEEELLLEEVVLLLDLAELRLYFGLLGSYAVHFVLEFLDVVLLAVADSGGAFSILDSPKKLKRLEWSLLSGLFVFRRVIFIFEDDVAISDGLIVLVDTLSYNRSDFAILATAIGFCGVGVFR